MKKLGMQTKDRDVDMDVDVTVDVTVESSESWDMKFDIIKGHLCVKCNAAAMKFAGRRYQEVDGTLKCH